MPDKNFFVSVLGNAIAQLGSEAMPVYTFAFYHDHESGAVSVCADTAANSARQVLATNRYNAKHFRAAVAEGDLAAASLWQANVGRNLSLGDFARVNVARAEFGGPEVGDEFYLLMVRALMAAESEVAALSPNPERLLFACSGPNDEVAYVWSLPTDAEPTAASDQRRDGVTIATTHLPTGRCGSSFGRGGATDGRIGEPTLAAVVRP